MYLFLQLGRGLRTPSEDKTQTPRDYGGIFNNVSFYEEIDVSFLKVNPFVSCKRTKLRVYSATV